MREILYVYLVQVEIEIGKKTSIDGEQLHLKYSKHIIVTSDNPRFEDPDKIIEDILEGIKTIQVFK